MTDSKEVSGHFAVIGQPIKHSLSPRIHQLFARQFGGELKYSKLDVPLGRFAQNVKRFFVAGGKGMNVTLPFKREAFILCQVVHEEAREARVANTLWQNENGWLCGTNTDGNGLVQDLSNLEIPLTNQRVLVIGAGGAVRGILGPLLKQKPVDVLIANRTFGKADNLARRFMRYGPVQGIPLTALPEVSDQPFDLIIQASSANHQGMGGLPALPDALCSKQTRCYDLSYGAAARPFMEWGRQAGCSVYDGLGMLVEQAALSFAIWFDGKMPDTTPVIAALRES